MKRNLIVGALALALSGSPAVAGQPSRGELLYDTYCIACHTEQVHWRDKKLVLNWASLVAEVRRWAVIGNLDWSTDDNEAVARYLNTLHYRYRIAAE